MIDVPERAKMQSAPLCGPKVVARLESIAVRRQSDLRSQDPIDLMESVNRAFGNPIWRRSIVSRALAHVIAAEHQAHHA